MEQMNSMGIDDLSQFVKGPKVGGHQCGRTLTVSCVWHKTTEWKVRVRVVSQNQWERSCPMSENGARCHCRGSKIQHKCSKAKPASMNGQQMSPKEITFTANETALPFLPSSPSHDSKMISEDIKRKCWRGNQASLCRWWFLNQRKEWSWREGKLLALYMRLGFYIILDWVF